MSALPVYIGHLEVATLPGCELDPAEVAGAFVHAFVVADSEAAARTRIEAQLEREHYRVVEWEWCYDIDDIDWDNPEEEQVFWNRARASLEVVFGTFYAFPHGN